MKKPPNIVGENYMLGYDTLRFLVSRLSEAHTLSIICLTGSIHVWKLIYFPSSVGRGSSRSHPTVSTGEGTGRSLGLADVVGWL